MRLVAILFTIAILSLPNTSHANNYKIEPCEAYSIAVRELAKRYITTDTSNLTLTLNDTVINACIDQPTIKGVEIYPVRYLKNHTYWTVYYTPPEEPGYVILGGAACVYIDVYTGEILGVTLEE